MLVSVDSDSCHLRILGRMTLLDMINMFTQRQLKDKRNVSQVVDLPLPDNWISLETIIENKVFDNIIWYNFRTKQTAVTDCYKFWSYVTSLRCTLQPTTESEIQFLDFELNRSYNTDRLSPGIAHQSQKMKQFIILQKVNPVKTRNLTDPCIWSTIKAAMFHRLWTLL